MKGEKERSEKGDNYSIHSSNKGSINGIACSGLYPNNNLNIKNIGFSYISLC